jgi:hypothetical protein
VEAAPEKMFPQILERVRGGRHVSAADYVSGWNLLRDIRVAFNAAMAGFDAIIMPTAPIMPPNADRLLTDDAYYKTENLLALRNTRIANLLDLTSLTLPTDAPSCGIMFPPPKYTEARLLRIVVAAEAALRYGQDTKDTIASSVATIYPRHSGQRPAPAATLDESGATMIPYMRQLWYTLSGFLPFRKRRGPVCAGYSIIGHPVARSLI